MKYNQDICQHTSTHAHITHIPMYKYAPRNTCTHTSHTPQIQVHTTQVNSTHTSHLCTHLHCTHIHTPCARTCTHICIQYYKCSYCNTLAHTKHTKATNIHIQTQNTCKSTLVQTQFQFLLSVCVPFLYHKYTHTNTHICKSTLVHKNTFGFLLSVCVLFLYHFVHLGHDFSVYCRHDSALTDKVDLQQIYLGSKHVLLVLGGKVEKVKMSEVRVRVRELG